MNHLVLFAFIILVLTIMGNSASTEKIVGELREIDTHLGKVTIRIVGDLGADKIPVICLPGYSPALGDEWVKVAEPLSKHGFVSAIINFHSNPNTKPSLVFGGIQPHDVSKIINEAVLHNVFHAEKAMILGKSWGGYMAFTHATNHPTKVLKLAIQAPGFSTHERIVALHKSKVPTFLAWAKDDPIVWYSGTEQWLAVFKDELVLYTAAKGGHEIVDEYAEPILKFLQ